MESRLWEHLFIYCRFMEFRCYFISNYYREVLLFQSINIGGLIQQFLNIKTKKLPESYLEIIPKEWKCI
ncbi:hypothetical protein M0811_14534 [Anaeramoeba ignava]|uniref:Uncharacterized protein n=1 Tax=Anaeramoeba ignava TaxID=1746090 RepID=A0A9Q0LV29_ANAIG|nr:hypothetical protein M0811_14534 [Anaeramoeba ignava]